MSGNSATPSRKRKHGVDSLLQALGKSLPVGGSIRLRLVKGSNSTLAADPVDPKAPKQAFPIIAKFPESVVPPEFIKRPWNSSRLYQQDVPKALEDSDDEEAAAADATKKKKRWRQFEAPKRQWIMQDEQHFLRTMVAKREKKKNPMETDGTELFAAYEGVPEHNSSKFIILQQQHDASNMTGSNVPTLTCRMVPAGDATVLFAQPSARASLSLSQAQAVMEQQKGRPGLLRLPATTTTTSAAPFPAAAARSKNNNQNNSKNRLLGKLLQTDKGDAAEEAEDVMADVKFRSKRGASGARKELLSSLADGSVRVGEDGVLGGTNDAVFAARQRFNAFSSKNDEGNANTSGGGAEQERGADGAAMQDDFYQRDVQAEYDELDYDANEQFDDDDVDVGETEVKFDEADYEGEDDEEEDEEAEDEEEVVSGAEGLASLAGFKRMLAKARGEGAATLAEAGATDAEGKKDGEPGIGLPNADDSKIVAVADKGALVVKDKGVQAAFPKKAPDAEAAKDENGLRIITMDAMREEIWLHHGAITLKRLMKIFQVKKKGDAARKEAFSSIVKELCNMKSDPIQGSLLVLKQHYSKRSV